MAQRVNESFQELKHTPDYTVVYFTRDLADLNEDFYNVGLLLPATIPKGIRESIQISFLMKVQRAYHSQAVKSILDALGKFYGYNWDSEPLDDQLLTEKLPRLKTEIPEGRDLIVARAPIPKNEAIIKTFVSELEKLVNGEKV